MEATFWEKIYLSISRVFDGLIKFFVNIFG